MAKKKRKASRVAQLERRKRDQGARKLAADRDRLFALSPGGSKASPMRVSSVATIESKAAKVDCPQCAKTLVIDEHSAVQVDGQGLRLIRAHCSGCRAPRELWFRIDTPLAN